MLIRFTEEAAEDITSIYLYSLENFGPARAESYVSELENCINLLAEMPKMGKNASMVKTGLRRHHHQSHVIYYRIQASNVLVYRILGAAQDPGRHL